VLSFLAEILRNMHPISTVLGQPFAKIFVDEVRYAVYFKPTYNRIDKLCKAKCTCNVLLCIRINTHNYKKRVKAAKVE